MIQKAYKFRLYPSTTQKELIDKTIGCCRFVYNHYLNERIIAYKENNISLKVNDNINNLSKLKKLEEFYWLKEVDSQALQQSLKDLDNAYKNFFRIYSGFPKFKSKKYSKLSYRTTNICIRLKEDGLYLSKLGKIKFKQDRKIVGRILNATITHTKSDKYFISICVEQEDFKPLSKTNKSIGLDLGLKDFLIDSNGIKYKNEKYLKQSLEKLAKLQRQLSRKSIGSSNWNKARIKVARLQEHIANQRLDFSHKLSTQLIRENGIICIENLKVSNMLKNHKLARSISDVAWSQFISQLEYKANWYGKTLVKVDTFYPSSKTCSCCGYKNAELTLADRSWVCPNCKTNLYRDINAAKNILNAGLRILSS